MRYFTRDNYHKICAVEGCEKEFTSNARNALYCPAHSLRTRRVAATKAKALVRSEHIEQVQFIQWCNLQSAKYPELELIYAIPNGGARHVATAVKLKQEGVKKGILDLCLPVARGKYYSLYIEMKKESGGIVSPEQKWWIDRLTKQGFLVVVAKGMEQAKQFTLDYLNLSPK